MIVSLVLVLFSISNSVEGDINFSFDYNITKSNDTTFTVQYYFEVPYSKLVFLKKDNAFIAKYQATIQILGDEELLTGKFMTKEIAANKYEDTKSSYKFVNDSVNIIFYTSQIKGKKLVSSAEIKDLFSNNFGKMHFGFTLPDMTNMIKFYKNHILTPKHIYSSEPSKTETLSINLEIYSSIPRTCSLWVQKEVNNKQIGSVVRKNTKSVVLTSFYQLKPEDHFTMIDFSFPLAQLFKNGSGPYSIVVAGYGNNYKKVFETKGNFTIENSFFSSDDDYFEMVNRLLYTATDLEMKQLKSIPANKRDSAWTDFWFTRDPNPTSDINEGENEYFTRIDYCIENFSKGDRGYKSDRAKIYMKFGPPDADESTPFERYSNAYEIWSYYSIGKQFTFVDSHGFGVFILYEQRNL